jgi:WD40 repeat protein
MTITLIIFNFTIYASEDFNPAQIESIKIDGEVKDIQWSEDGNFLLVLSTDNIFYFYQLQRGLSTFSLNLYTVINLNCHEPISNFKPLQNNGIIIAGCFHDSGKDDVLYYDYNEKTFHKIAEVDDFSRVNISLGYSNRVLVISSGTKIKVFAVDGFDLILVYDISDFYVTRYVPYITGLVLDELSSRIIISDSDGILWKINYNSYILMGKSEIVIQDIEGLNGIRLIGIY